MESEKNNVIIILEKCGKECKERDKKIYYINYNRKQELLIEWFQDIWTQSHITCLPCSLPH